MKMLIVGRKIRIVYPEIDIKNMKVKVVDQTKIYLNQAAEKQGKYNGKLITLIFLSYSVLAYLVTLVYLL